MTAWIVALCAIGAVAQDGDEALKEKLAAKLKKPFVEKGGWLTDYELALKTAKDGGGRPGWRS